MKERPIQLAREENMNRNRMLYCQKHAIAALREEFGFAPARLKEIVLLETDDMCFYIHFRITDDKGAAL
jgi:hypothetical protein